MRLRAGPTWLPENDLPGVTLVASASRSGFTLDTDEVLQWDDLSPAVHHLTDSGANRPQKVTQGGFDAVQYIRAEDDWLETGELRSTLFGTTGLIAVVIELDGLPARSQPEFWDNDHIVLDLNGFMGISARNDGAGGAEWTAGIYDTTERQFTVPTVVGTRQVLILRWDGTNVDFALDGVDETQILGGDVGENTNITVGVVYSSLASQCYIYEVVFASANADSDVALLTAYLKAEWGIA